MVCVWTARCVADDAGGSGQKMIELVIQDNRIANRHEMKTNF